MTRRLAGLFVLSIWFTATKAQAQATRPPEPPRTLETTSLDKYVDSVVRAKGITGLSLAVVRDGKLVLAKGYGKRSLEDGSAVEVDTRFAAGSVTKQFACACILLLAEDGKLSVDDKVAKYYPTMNRAADISLYQLMTHTSGYPDYYPLDFVDRRMTRPIPLDQLIKDYAGGPLDFEPGSRWSYSNTGYMILGRVVEKVSGESFGSFLQKRILEPVGMKHSVFEPGPGVSALARGYTPFALEGLQPAVPEALGWLYAAGGLWTSATDLARWDLALMDGRVLKPESLRIMTAPVILSEGRVRDYGCGLTVKRENGYAVLGHGGAVSGFRASNTMVPGTRSAVVVMTNDEKSDPGLTRLILDLMIRTPNAPDVPKVAGPPPKEAALSLFHQMQSGQLDRSKLGEEFSIYLTDERVRGASAKLKALGEPKTVAVETSRERGGMEVTSVRLTFPTLVLEGLLYRSPDGKIQQLLFEKGD